MKNILSICMSLLIITTIFLLIYYSYNIREGMNEQQLCLLKRECSNCDLTKKTQDCSLSWVLQPGAPVEGRCTVWNGDNSSSIAPGYYDKTEIPCDTTIAFQSQNMYDRELQNIPDVGFTNQPGDDESQNMPVTEDLLVSFIEKGTAQLNDVLTSKDIYDRMKKMSEKYLNNTTKKDSDPFNDPQNMQKRYINRYDNPDMKPYNNINPSLKTVLDNPILITEDNIDDMPISYSYMKNTKGPSWTDSLRPFN